MNWMAAGSLFGFLGVALGAFGAHALRSRLPPDLLAVFEVGVRYQIVHALALLVVGLAAGRADARGLRVAGSAFTLGILIFSGSLYLLAATGARAWGAVTPVGGAAFLVGWLALAWAARNGGLTALTLFALLAGPREALAQGEQLAVTAGTATFTDENLSTPLPTELTLAYGGQRWQLRALGSGLRKKLVFKVYVGALYVQDSTELGQDPAAAVCRLDVARQMTLTMKRGLSASKISEAINEGFIQNVWGKEPEPDLRRKLDEFVALFTGDLKSGDRIELTYLPGVGLLTTLAGRSLPIVSEPRIAQDIWSIWLGPKPVSEDLKKNLVRLAAP